MLWRAFDSVIIELVNTGSELMLGRVLNTHQQWLCRQLADFGAVVSRQTAVADNGAAIEQVVGEALGRADVVITTGGLGPTSDDITRERIAALLGRKLIEDPVVLAHIKEFFQIRGRPLPDHARVQALVPEGALVLPNPHGTAPGLAIKIQLTETRKDRNTGSWLIMLPGPPRELRPMFCEQVVPLLRRVSAFDESFTCRTLRTAGLGESLVQEKIADALRPCITQGLDLGYCARPGQVDVRLAARGPDAKKLVALAEKLVLEHLAPHVFGVEDEELEHVIIRLLTERKQTLALAESCTGGAIAHRLTNVPGASAVFLAGAVTYSNDAKMKFLGVLPETLAQHGAVSEPVAREMAEGVRVQAGADFALSVTGIAGPTGAVPGKPVGAVFIGLAGDFETIVERNFNPYDRETFKQVTAQQAMELFRQKLLDF